MKAVRSIWIVGDKFLRSLFPLIAAIRTQAHINNKDQPYIFQEYNVKTLHQSAFNNPKSTLARINNAIVSEMNKEDNYQLARYIIVMLDSDLIELLGYYDCGVKQLMMDVSNWLCVNIAANISARKEDLKTKRSRAVWSTSEPCMIWLSMVTRPKTSAKKEIFSLVSKCNSVLENIIETRSDSNLMTLNSVMELSHFDGWGRLTPAGKAQYWHKFNYQFQQFDSGKMDLFPVVSKHENDSRSHSDYSTKSRHSYRQRSDSTHRDHSLHQQAVHSNHSTNRWSDRHRYEREYNRHRISRQSTTTHSGCSSPCKHRHDNFDMYRH